MRLWPLGLVVLALGGCASMDTLRRPPDLPTGAAQASTAVLASGGERMQLGAFSVSLAVKDIAASRVFYEKLGFKPVGGDAAKNWLIMRNESTTIGLFQGMFEKNTLTFNPGWDGEAKPLDDFEDVRALQRALKAQGVKPTTEVDESGKGPGHFVLADPDGNPILFDQHVPGK